MQSRLEVSPYPFRDAARLERELGVSHVLAQVLVRRGYGEPDAARAFLAADEVHPPSAFAGIDAAVETVLRHVQARSPIVVHGDYDVDGVCSTAILVRVLRSLRADVGWFIPGRLQDGYGLSAETVERLAGRGTSLLLTADCAVTAVEEVARARALGMDVVVTDHHSPRPDGGLPDAPLVHPALCGYPCAELCAAGVAHKLTIALLEGAGADPAIAAQDMDLVALATVADVVPLRGENRRLVREGLRALAGTARPGLRALMRVARVDPSRLDARAAAFRLAPRINAAGRLYRADAGVELLLTDDEERAQSIAAELGAVNAERRAVEQRTLFEAERLVREEDERAAAGALPAAPDGRPWAYVLGAEGWHPGVIGIVASRIAERHHRPAVLVALDGDRGTGSGRSIPGFDLLAGLNAAGEHLARHGGHRAAAGLELERTALDAFRAAFVAHAGTALEHEELVPVERVDAVVTGDALGAELAEELERLEPCGAGNPAPTLLVPAATCAEPRAMGDGRHLRFTLHAGGIRARAVCFGSPRLPVPEGEPVDAAVRLELDEHAGAVAPRLVLRSARSCRPPPIEVVGEPRDWLAAALAQLDDPAGSSNGAGEGGTGEAPPGLSPARAGEGPAETGREVVDRRGAGIAGVIADLVACGEGVLVACAEVSRRRAGLAERVGGFALCRLDAIGRDPGIARNTRHVVLLDPPAQADPPPVPGPGWLHLAWGEPETEFARRVHEFEWETREQVAALYRALRALGRAQGGGLAAALRGDGAHPRCAAHAGRLLRVLQEMGVVAVDRERAAVTVPPARRTELARSAAFRSYTRCYEQGLRWLPESTARAA